MKLSKLVLITIFTLAFLMALSTQSFAKASESQGAADILVKFTADATSAERQILYDEMGAKLVRWMPEILTAQVRTEVSQTRMTSEAIQIAGRSRSVRSVEYDATIAGIPIETEQIQISPSSVQSTIPPSPVHINDPDFNNPQWVYAPGIIGLPSAWSLTMGQSSVVVAILDSGVNASHPDLQGRVLDGYDFVNDDDIADDDQGHGTHVAGVVAATANNGIGSAGVCPLCMILPVKVLDQNNSGTWSSVAAGILYATDHGANVINMSLGGASMPTVMTDAIAYASQHNVVIVAAAGNGRSEIPFYPAALDNVIAVSATRDDDTRWSLSNYGSWIDVAAPGYAIYSTYYDLNNFYGGYQFMSGTSMAAPHVAGVAGLIMSLNSSLSAAQVGQVLRSSATDLGDSGEDIYFGAGRVDALAALQTVMPQSDPSASLSGQLWIDTNRNGVRDSEEESASLPATINVRDSQDVLIVQAVPDIAGVWQVSGLAADQYTVEITSDVSVVVTSAQSYNVSVVEGQEMNSLDFGVVAIDSSHITNYVYIPVVQSGQ